MPTILDDERLEAYGKRAAKPCKGNREDWDTVFERVTGALMEVRDQTVERLKMLQAMMAGRAHKGHPTISVSEHMAHLHQTVGHLVMELGGTPYKFPSTGASGEIPKLPYLAGRIGFDVRVWEKSGGDSRVELHVRVDGETVGNATVIASGRRVDVEDFLEGHLTLGGLVERMRR